MAITGDGLRVQGIGHLLASNTFRVPSNQRSYMWEEEHVTHYWNDIINAMHGESAEEDYFIGTIVLSETDGDDLEVVDGQQRLATTTIILATIRDFFLAKNRNTGRARDIAQRYLIGKNETTLDDEPRLSLNEYDNQFFQDFIVQSPPDGGRENPLDKNPKQRLRDSHKNLIAACKKVRELLYHYVGGNTARDEDQESRIVSLIKYIKEHVKVITVTVPDHENAYTIFETLNDRGLDLTKADLLKNHLLRAAKKRDKEVQSKWALMIAGLETVTKNDITVDFIRYLWISVYGHVRSKELYTKIKAKIKQPGEAVEFANLLADSASVYAAILNSDHPRWTVYGEEAKIDLSNLIMLGIERIHPITLAIARTFKKPEEVKKALSYLVTASVRLLIAGPAPGGQFEKNIADIAPKISTLSISTAKALAAEMNKEIVPADAEFAAQFATASVSQTHLAKYYLRAINNAFDKNERTPSRVGSQAKNNIEHILPFNLESAKGWGHITDDVGKAYVRRIGNLTLLTPKENENAGDKDYLSVKVPIYKASFPISQDAATWAKAWGVEAIDDRQKRLAAMALKIWSIKLS